MSDFTGLISDDFKQLHVDMITEVIRGASVECTLIYGDTKFTDCPNCIFSPLTGKSSNIYEAGGPIPFTFGICPYCKGAGKLPIESTTIIDLALIFDYKSWIPGLSTNIQSPNGFVQTISLFDTFEDLKNAKELLVQEGVEQYIRYRFERYSEPEPCGLGSHSFIATMWKRIEG